MSQTQMGITEARKQALASTTTLFKDWNTLKAILDRHELTIHKRWTKKSQVQRRQVLLSAWPNMPAHHRPDLLAVRKEISRTSSHRSNITRDCFMWPSLNLEDLIGPRALLLFMKSRGRTLPDAFAVADLTACCMGIETGAIRYLQLKGYKMSLHRSDSQTYGRIHSCDESQDLQKRLANGTITVPGAGLILLEIQTGILKFLIECCHQILHDLPKCLLTGDTFPVQPEPPMSHNSDPKRLNLKTITTEAQYRVPQRIDFERIHALASARCQSAQDHIHALREDPGYFCSFIYDASRHRREQMGGDNVEELSALHNPPKCRIFWQFVLRSIVTAAYGDLLHWHELKRHTAELIIMDRKYGNSLSVTNPLPLPYHHSLVEFFSSLSLTWDYVGVRLYPGFQSSAECYSLWTRQSPPGATRRNERPFIHLHGWEDHMTWVDNVLLNTQKLSIYDIWNNDEVLQTTMETDQKEGKRISGWLAEQLSDFALVTEFHRQLDLFRPWIQHVIDDPATDMSPDIQIRFPVTILNRALAVAFLKEQDFHWSNRFYYPADKSPNEKNIKAMRSAEASLDALWRGLDDALAMVGVSIKILFPGCPMQRELRRTSPWVKKEMSTQCVNAYAASTTANKFEALDLEEKTQATIGSDNIVTPKDKPKSRGAGNSQNYDSGLEENEPQEPEKPVFTVSKRAHKVFASMFFNPEYEQPRGEIPWSDFVHAMSSVGFAVEKLYGSVWQFTPKTLNVDRSMQFHEPHPSTKIPLIILRRYGRRLHREYGWTLENFQRRNRGAELAGHDEIGVTTAPGD